MRRAWYLADPEQECSLAILEGELGCRVMLLDGGSVEGLEAVEELELSEEHLGAAFGDTTKVQSVPVSQPASQALVYAFVHVSPSCPSTVGPAYTKTCLLLRNWPASSVRQSSRKGGSRP
jgi:hypothetical protein